ncbi:30S ribosomal protein S6 [Candidatus Dependentiae bacterium]|nr:30S ribosomal protein S6 [Candidatus Dependentiae bacterium]
MMLVRSESTAEDRAFLEKSITALVAQHGGVFGSFDQWGKFKLAYPVEKESYGLYILVRYQLPVSTVDKFLKDLYMFFRIKTGEFMMRHVNVRLEDDAPTVYLRPEAYDSSKAMAEAGSFVKGGRGRGDRPGRPFNSSGAPGKRFSHDHSSEDVMEAVTDEIAG